MDRLAREGAMCLNAFHTTLLCSPNRASIVTGVCPWYGSAVMPTGAPTATRASGWHTGAMGFDDLKWVRPVRPGDVLASRSRPDRGTVKIESRIINQRGEIVMSLVSLVIYLRR